MVVGLTTRTAVMITYFYPLIAGMVALSANNVCTQQMNVLTQVQRGLRNPHSMRLPRRLAGRLRVLVKAPQPHLHHESQALSHRGSFSARREPVPGWPDRGCWSARRVGAR